MEHSRAGCAPLRFAAAFLITAFSPQIALAICDDNTPASGDSVTCTGADTTGIQAPSSTDVTVQIDSGASINTAGTSAINLGAGANVTNAGSLTASGADTVELNTGDNSLTNSGDISNSGGLAIDFGSGRDTFIMQSGSVSGHIEQRDGTDTFEMHGGVIDSLDQGGGLDNALITGGRIIGTLSDGDFTTMTGGRVGQINLQIANNEMDMQGGRVDNNILAGFQNDTLRMSGGMVGNSVDFGRGNNTIHLSGGAIGNRIITGVDADSFTWSGAGTVGDSVQLGAGDDTGALYSVSTLNNTTLNASSGDDSLLLSDQLLDNPARLQQWETIRLSDGSTILFDSDLTLGGADALPTRLIVDNGSTLLIPEFNITIAPAAGQALAVMNSGSIDLRGDTSNQLTIFGDYAGNSTLYLDAVLEDDDSAADRLIISGGAASGSTEILVNQLGGSGAQTDNGILLVEAVGGATTAADAFFMAGSLSAGPYEYFLFRGADDSAEADNWYLRSSLLPGSAPASTSPPSPGPGPEPQPPAPQVAPAPPPGSDPIPLFRPEIPLYSQAKALARQTALDELGTYHKRRGEQRSWSNGINNAWLRLYYQNTQLDWEGDVDNRFDGYIGGFQLGGNLYAAPDCGGGARESGLFFGTSRANGDVHGFARGFPNFDAGRNELTSQYVGFYFTDYNADQSYLDLIVKVGYLELESRSVRDWGDTVYGPQLTLSAEKGFTVSAGNGFNLEPQLHAIVTYSNLDAYEDGVSKVEPDMTPEATFRAGLRGYNTGGRNQYYLFGNLWHTLGGDDELLFRSNLRLDLERRATWAEVGVGIVLLERNAGSAFFNLSYQRSVDSLDWEGGSANLGINWAW